MTMHIDVEWLDGSGVQDSAEAATWARIELHVNGVAVSELIDERSGSVRKGFFGAVLPLAEWLVDVWPRLLHERRIVPPGSPGWAEWAGFHHIRAARQGGAMPDLRIVRYNDEEIRLCTVPDGDKLPPGISIRFFRDVDARLDVQTVEVGLARFIEKTLERVSGIHLPRVERFQTRWEKIRADRMLAFTGRLGIDDEAIDPADEQTLLATLNDTDSILLLGIAEGSTAASIRERIEEARTLLAIMPMGGPATEQWSNIGQLVLHRRPRPWLTGWGAAQALRDALRLPIDDAPGGELPVWMESRCGWPADRQVFDLPPQGGNIETVNLRRRGQTPVVATSARSQQARRFRLARALYYFLFAHPGSDEASIADSLLIDSGERSEANAFAAELLAPVAWLRREAPPSGVWSQERVEEAARNLQVSPIVVIHQIENRNIGVMAD
jgi:Zn-dependent peptidase ImmA (M78 family)